MELVLKVQIVIVKKDSMVKCANILSATTMRNNATTEHVLRIPGRIKNFVNVNQLIKEHYVKFQFVLTTATMMENVATINLTILII